MRVSAFASAFVVCVSLPARADDVTVRGEVDGPPYARSTVTRVNLEERLPRSAPDALRFEPGVFVQQTGHGQASVFLRGRTGQQTVLVFDGIRLNTSLFRQGPNQYFFTVDTASVTSIEVTRGGASTRWGSDAIGGALEAKPLLPERDPTAHSVVRPRTQLRYQSADAMFGERFQLDAQIDPATRVLAGVGYKHVGLLRAGGPIRDATGQPTETPAFDTDGKTQLGTGYDERTFDVRVERDLRPDLTLTAALYGYRQTDAPRTDQCPPPRGGGRPEYECLTVNEQFRTLAYVGADGRLGAAAESSFARVFFQRQHELRTKRQASPQSRNVVRNVFRDDVNTTGFVVGAATAKQRLDRWGTLRLRYGADLTRDAVSSRTTDVFDTYGFSRKQPRGTYVEGSSYVHGGAYTEGELTIAERVTFQLGARGGLAMAHVPAVPEAGSLAVDRSYPLFAANFGQEVRVSPALSWLVHVDRSLRAPNLDDLSSRQQTGPGFQFENAKLGPEIGYGVETGLRARLPTLEAEGWVYRSWLTGQMTRVGKAQADCPATSDGCGSSRSRFQLENAPGAAVIWGLEGAVKWRPERRVTVTSTIAYAYGAQPNPVPQSSLAESPEYVVPLSRIPPLNGSVELRVRPFSGFHIGGALRWATEQDRLSIADRSDRRIPIGGTPGYGVWDVRAGYRVRRELVTSLVLENVTDAAYRAHGSGINGPGRGVLLLFDAGL